MDIFDTMDFSWVQESKLNAPSARYSCFAVFLPNSYIWISSLKLKVLSLTEA